MVESWVEFLVINFFYYYDYWVFCLNKFLFLSCKRREPKEAFGDIGILGLIGLIGYLGENGDILVDLDVE